MKVSSVVPEASPALAVDDGSSTHHRIPKASYILRFADFALEGEFQEFLRRKETVSGCGLVGSQIYLAISLCAIAMLTGLGYYYDGTHRDSFDEVGKYQIAGVALLVGVIFAFEGAMGRCGVRGRLLWGLLISLWLLCSLWFTLLSTPVFSSLLDKSQSNDAISGSVPLLLINISMSPSFRCKTILYTITGFTSLLLYISINLCVSAKDPITIVFDFFVLSLSVLYCDLSILIHEKLTRFAFAFDTSLDKSNRSFSNPFQREVLSPRTEYAGNLTNLNSALQDGASLDALTPLKAAFSLNESKDLENSKVAISVPQIHVQIESEESSEMSKAIDDEDREFVKQNYMASRASEYQKNSEKAVTIVVPMVDWMNEYHLNELQAVLNQFGKNWNFDTFFLQEVTNGKALSVAGRYCLLKYDLIAKLSVADMQAECFFTAVEGKYKPNPYHNSCHGADVLNSTLYLILHSQVPEFLTSLEILGVVIGSLCHDVGHGALTNRFLVNTRDDLAIRCNL